MKTKMNESSLAAKETIANAIEIIVNEIITLCKMQSNIKALEHGKTKEPLGIDDIRDFVLENKAKMTSREMAETLRVPIMRIAGAKAAITRQGRTTEKLQKKDVHVSEDKKSTKAIQDFIIENKGIMSSRLMAFALDVSPKRIAGAKAAITRQKRTAEKLREKEVKVSEKKVSNKAIRAFVIENKDRMTSTQMATTLNVSPKRIAGAKAALKREKKTLVPIKNESPTICEALTNNSQLGGFNEFSQYRISLTSGCPNDCKYCYAKRDAIVRSKTRTVDTWKDVTCRVNILKKNFGKMHGLIGYQSTSDITPEFLNEHIQVIRKLLLDDNQILIVTKPRLECIKRICDEFQSYKDNLAFRFSIGSTDSDILHFWETNASTFEERLECLKYAFAQGFKTSISAEPLLDQDVDKLITELQPYVTDTIWLGRMNSAIYRIKTNGHGDEETIAAAERLIKWQSNKSFWIDVYRKYKDNKQVVYKKSVRKILGIG